MKTKWGNVPLPDDPLIDNFYDRTDGHVGRVVNNIKYVIDNFRHTSFDKGELHRRGTIHDASKYNDEFLPYVWLTEFYRCKQDNEPFSYPDGVEPIVDKATFEHIKVNRHHPEYHSQPSDMTTEDIIEMICDHCAMSQELNDSLRDWTDNNTFKKYKWTPEQVDLINALVDLLEKTLMKTVKVNIKSSEMTDEQRQSISEGLKEYWKKKKDKVKEVAKDKVKEVAKDTGQTLVDLAKTGVKEGAKIAVPVVFSDIIRQEVYAASYVKVVAAKRLKKIKLKLKVHQGKKKVDALQVNKLLAIHPTNKSKTEWTLDHIPTGFGIAMGLSKASAIELAQYADKKYRKVLDFKDVEDADQSKFQDMGRDLIAKKKELISKDQGKRDERNAARREKRKAQKVAPKAPAEPKQELKNLTIDKIQDGSFVIYLNETGDQIAEFPHIKSRNDMVKIARRMERDIGAKLRSAGKMTRNARLMKIKNVAKEFEKQK